MACSHFLRPPQGSREAVDSLNVDAAVAAVRAPYGYAPTQSSWLSYRELCEKLKAFLPLVGQQRMQPA
jgi:hypothetical protein